MDKDLNALIESAMEKHEKTRRAKKYFLELANALYAVRKLSSEAFKALYGQLKMQRRKAYCLTQIHEAFSAYPELHPRLIQIGWTKLGLIAKLVKPENMEELLEFAGLHSAAKMREIFANPNKGGSTFSVKLTFSAPEYVAFLQAITPRGAAKGAEQHTSLEAALLSALKAKAA
jgi:hypothetical protein